MPKPRAPKFKVGQVVRIATPWYSKGARRSQRYQKITKVFPWPECKTTPFGYVFLNGDECNEKYVKAQTKREAGRG